MSTVSNIGLLFFVTKVVLGYQTFTPIPTVSQDPGDGLSAKDLRPILESFQKMIPKRK